MILCALALGQQEIKGRVVWFNVIVGYGNARLSTIMLFPYETEMASKIVCLNRGGIY